MAYQPIENYGVIGDLRTVALVGMDGSIDWLCLPRFDSPSVFAALLDDRIGGRFRIAPIGEAKYRQIYWPDTNILITRFFTAAGVGEIVDFMPVSEMEEGAERQQLIRRVAVARGELRFRLECRPAFNYARDRHELALTPEGAVFRTGKLDLGLGTTVPLRADGNAVVGEFVLREGETTTLVLEDVTGGSGGGERLTETEWEERFRKTLAYWRRWIAQCEYAGRWQEMVRRSSLVLKLLTFEPTGAIVAAPTTSLPETIGGGRNWDYRFTWIRDSAFTIYGLLRIGFTSEAKAFMGWIDRRTRELNPDGTLQVMYGIDGRHDLTEETLDHLEGYRGSRPVRIGNGAFTQNQTDIYGELMDSVYLYNKYVTPISYDLWVHLRRLVDWVCGNWESPDEGIWEVRGGPRHFVYSKMMCWVAVDRGIRLADKRSFPADRARWLATRDRIYEEIMTQGWSPKRRAFVQSYGTDTLDAANLMMPLVFFLSPTDERMLQTLEATLRPLDKRGLVSNHLVYRYNLEEAADGVAGSEGTFSICTFWLVEALTRAGRAEPKRLEEARLIFDRMLGYANHLGLYSEEIGLSGEAMGNFPQAFTHLALISAAYNLDKTLGTRE